MVYPDPKFLIFKTKKRPHFFSEAGGWFFLILCYHARHLQQIHWNKLLFWMYGLAVIASVPTLNICQILMRYSNRNIRLTPLSYKPYRQMQMMLAVRETKIIRCRSSELRDAFAWLYMYLPFIGEVAWDPVINVPPVDSKLIVSKTSAMTLLVFHVPLINSGSRQENVIF